MRELIRAIKPGHFLEKLSESSVDLARLVETIHGHLRLTRLHRESRANPFAKYSNGSPIFFIADPQDPQANLLDRFSDGASMGSYIQECLRTRPESTSGYNPVTLDNKTRKPLTAEYEGPKIRLLKDSNIKLETHETGPFLSELEEAPFIIPDMLSINQAECRGVTLTRIFNGVIPTTYTKTHLITKQKLGALTAGAQRELTLMDKISEGLFEREIEALRTFAEAKKGRPVQVIADEYARRSPGGYSKSYALFVRKILFDMLHGKEYNMLPDRTLASAAFAFNFADPGNRTVVISNDSDFLKLMDFFYHEILPSYLGSSIFNQTYAMKDSFALNKKSRRKLQRGVEAQIFGSRDLELQDPSAKEENQARWSRGTREYFERPFAAGILYVPIAREVHVKHVETDLIGRFK